MKLGTEDKLKVKALGGVLVVLVGVLYLQFFSGPATPTGAPTRPRAAAPQAQAARNISRQRPTPAPARGQNFEPIWRRSQEDETFDPVAADPTLQTGLLAAVRAVEFKGVKRNLFEFTTRKVKTPPPPKADVEEASRRQRELEQQAKRRAAKPTPAPKPAKNRAPKLTWKYYGFASKRGRGDRRAFLLDDEDVLIAGEGELLKKRYEIVRIGLTSIVIKDKDFDEDQTLPITVPET